MANLNHLYTPIACKVLTHLHNQYTVLFILIWQNNCNKVILYFLTHKARTIYYYRKIKYLLSQLKISDFTQDLFQYPN